MSIPDNLLHYPELIIKKNVIPYDDLQIQGGYARDLRLPGDVIPVIGTLSAQGKNIPKLLTCNHQEPALDVYVVNQASGGGSSGHAVQYAQTNILNGTHGQQYVATVDSPALYAYYLHVSIDQVGAITGGNPDVSIGISNGDLTSGFRPLSILYYVTASTIRKEWTIQDSNGMDFSKYIHANQGMSLVVNLFGVDNVYGSVDLAAGP